MKYKYVHKSIKMGKFIYYRAAVYKDGILYQKNFTNEREAAIYADKLLIEFGRDPVNILKRKM